MPRCQLVPRTLRSPFPETFPQRNGRAHTQRALCAFHNHRIPSAFDFTCLSLLPSAPLPVLTCSYQPLPFCRLQRRHEGTRRPSSRVKSTVQSRALCLTHPCCAALVAGPLSRCWNCVPCYGACALWPAWASLSSGPGQQSKA